MYSECPYQSPEEPVIYQADGAFVGIFTGSIITPVLCINYLNDWFKPGDCAIATAINYIVDFSPYTGNPNDIYDIPSDELEMLYLLGILLDRNVSGSQACEQGAGALLCAIAWQRCDAAKGCIDFINRAWCKQQQASCSDVDAEEIDERYGDYYFNLYNAVNCTNDNVYSDGNSTSKRQDRQLQRDYTPPTTDATPVSQCTLPKSDQSATKTAPATNDKHPCASNTTTSSSKNSAPRAFSAGVLFSLICTIAIGLLYL